MINSHVLRARKSHKWFACDINFVSLSRLQSSCTYGNEFSTHFLVAYFFKDYIDKGTLLALYTVWFKRINLFYYFCYLTISGSQKDKQLSFITFSQKNKKVKTIKRSLHFIDKWPNIKYKNNYSPLMGWIFVI